MLEFRRVTKTYDKGITALDNVELAIGRGEFVFLVGPSGAGKSTLLRMIFREERPTSGTVVFDGKDLVRMPARAIPYLRRQVGVVFQDYRLLSDKTVAENLAFAMQVTEADPKDIRRRVPQVLAQVGLAHRAEALPLELSGGEQQRVALARAIVNNPQVVVADEPTGNLDPDTARDIMDLLAAVQAWGATVIVASHSQAMVDRLRRRVVAMEAGRIVRDEAQGGYRPCG
ncbi:MAG: cell division ATP-binding protein FtsE [Bacillota bacterium]